MKEPVANRRQFLETVGTASILVGSGVSMPGLAAGADQKLALDGGEPVRTSLLGAFAACNSRINEFTGAVLRAQLQKLETICQGLRSNARKVREAIADLPGLKLRASPDLEGDLGVGVFLDLGSQERRDKFLRAMRAEGVLATAPGGSVILPTVERIEKKATVHPAWPSFQSPRGRAIQYGSACCPRTIRTLSRAAGVIMDSVFSEDEIRDIAKAIRKVYLALGKA
ncbi:MAG: hypothetical protein GX456_13290 [Verrucomicrobia bacterium]|nr:hypothetical protein [Verrucomicrobiota bacterium]